MDNSCSVTAGTLIAMSDTTDTTSKYPVIEELSVPDNVMKTWQETVDLLADLLHIPSALIMRAHPHEIEVFVKSQNHDNVYKAGESAHLDTGLYCETVMDTQRELLVPNALKDPKWDHNPDIEQGMISYYGLPLTWPSGEIFGTICVLDTKENDFSVRGRELMKRFQESVQLSIDTLYDNHIKHAASVNAREQLRILSQAVEQSPVSIVITDSDAHITYVNPAFESITGYRAEDVIGKNPRMLQSGQTPGNIYADLWLTINNKAPWEGDLQNKKKSGELYWEHAHIAPVVDSSGHTGHYIAIKEDITQQKEQAEHILHQALYDDLTDLPNRALIIDRIKQQLVEAQRDQQKVAVLFLDLDDFKKVNDSLGHEEGDKLLIQAAQRIKESVREGDTVGRFGGDEFVIVLGNISAASDAQPVAEHLLEHFRNIFRIDGRDLLLTSSLGIAIYPDDGTSPSELLRKADSAMYHSKELGRNTYSYYTDAMNQEVSRRLRIEEQMHGAIERGEFQVHYQPQVAVSSGSIIGVEALLRWHNPVLGNISPVEFIPIAEQTGLILPIGQFVLNESIQMAAKWQYSYSREFKVAVNLSPIQFRDPSLLSSIENALFRHDVPGECLELEITEGVLLSGHSLVGDILDTMITKGLNIAMDDFGTGYSSLSNLRSYPFNVLKIDRSFISDITKNVADLELVVATIAMAHGLGLKVVAEGVETDEQLNLLKELKCDIAQGYLFSKPLPATKLTSMLEQSEKGEALSD